MADIPTTAAGDECQPLPDCPELAMFVATMFQGLGGRLSIENGQRCIHRPEPALRGEPLPALPGGKPHLQFQNPEEWQGAMKFAEYWLTRLGPADKEFVFTLLAPVCAHRPETFDFRGRLQ